MSPDQIADYVRRDAAWKTLVKHLIRNCGCAPEYPGVSGLWVDLYDEAVAAMREDGD